MSPGPKVVVTGGAGFIGANLTRQLIASGIAGSVTVVDDLSTGSRDNLAGVEGVHLVVGSILEPTTLDGAMDGADAVVHLAARPSVPRSMQDPRRTHDVNATGTIEVLEAVRRAGGPYAVVASSSSVYGASPELPKHEQLAPAPLSPYAASKLATEAYTVAYAASFGLEVLPLRFFNVFGPLQPADHAYAAVIPAFVAAGLTGQALPVHGDGRQTRDFTYVGSVATAICEAISRRVTSPMAVNLAFGSRRSLLEVVAVLGDVLGRELPVEHRAPRSGDVRHSQADRTRLLTLFPEFEPVPFRDGLEATVAWMREAMAVAV
ncbi:MAG: NAD-dependent epimerase/dehydratase family protein [Nitriliruptorales bacterium]|nr:NAD-dependent epimerase/dehydratase family protein [Nitriliruptorales bacterium]